MKMITRATQITVVPEGEPIFAEGATIISVDDESSGEYIVIEQHLAGRGKVAIDPEEWGTIKEAVESLIADIKVYERKDTKGN